MYGTPKFLEIPVTSKPATLVAIADIVTVAAGDANTKLEFLMSSGKIIRFTTGADAGVANVTVCNTGITNALDWNVAKKGAKSKEAVTLTVAATAVAVV
tara:strand:- start:329 stop:625 length:297 start_codon:yes stop_codon:yes gene_type:complete